MTSRFTTGALAAAAILAAASPLAAQKGPAATSTHLSPEVLSLACAPRATLDEPSTAMRVTGGQDSFVRIMHAPGDLVTINVGKKNGIEVGQEFYVRRLQVHEQARVTKDTPATIRTTGWIKVWAVDDEWSLTTITHACDSIEIGDFLEAFALPTLPNVSKDRLKPERNNYARVLSGDDRRVTFGTGDYLVIDHGSEQGIQSGSQFVLYRNKKQDQNFLYIVGEGVAVDVKPTVATIQVTQSSDAISKGDLVALRRIPEETK